MGRIIGGTSTGGVAAAPTAASRILNNLHATSFDPILTNNEATAPATGVLTLSKVAWESTQTITTFMVWQGTTIGTVLSNCYLCAYDSSGNLLCATADQSTALQGASNGAFSANASVATSVPGSAGSWIWLGIQIGAATVIPTFGNWGSTLNAALTNFNVGGGASTRYGQLTTGNATLPNPITVASISSVAKRFLIGAK
jgi:hypothetical protein